MTRIELDKRTKKRAPTKRVVMLRSKVDRAMLGPPKNAWANPTLWLFIACVAAFSSAIAFHAAGWLPVPVATIVNCVALYAIYTVTHEAIHQLAHVNPRINGWMGRIAAAIEGITFPIVCLAHRQHHVHTNDPQYDPDYIVGRKPTWLLPLWLLIRLTHDNWFAIRNRLWSRKNGLLTEHVFTIFLQVAVVSTFVYMGYWREIVFLWLLPVMIAGVLLHFTVAWLVHYPHESEQPLESTRLFNGGILRVLLLNQSRHLVHHLWPRIAWFRYGALASFVEQALAMHRRQIATPATYDIAAVLVVGETARFTKDQLEHS